MRVKPSENAERLTSITRTPIPIVRCVQLVKSTHCKCGRSHGSWNLYKQHHENKNFRYFLKCIFCGYELAKKYWDIDYSNGHIDYIEEQEKNYLTKGDK